MKRSAPPTQLLTRQLKRGLVSRRLGDISCANPHAFACTISCARQSNAWKSMQVNPEVVGRGARLPVVSE
jgi:hypothetical protein